jgi:hypothetical protein
MGLQKGRTNNPHGRKPGIPNKMTKELRKILKVLVESELKKLPKRMIFLKKKERIELLIKLLPYVLPKVESVSHTSGEPLDLSFM